jgi:hypothetical protein
MEDSLKKLEKLAKEIVKEFTIDDDVTGGHLEEPYKGWVTEINQIVDKLDFKYIRKKSNHTEHESKV